MSDPLHGHHAALGRFLTEKYRSKQLTPAMMKQALAAAAENIEQDIPAIVDHQVKGYIAAEEARIKAAFTHLTSHHGKYAISLGVSHVVKAIHQEGIRWNETFGDNGAGI